MTKLHAAVIHLAPIPLDFEVGIDKAVAFALSVVAVLLALDRLDLARQDPASAAGGSAIDCAGAAIAFAFGLPFRIVIFVICRVGVARRLAKL